MIATTSQLVVISKCRLDVAHPVTGVYCDTPKLAVQNSGTLTKIAYGDILSGNNGLWNCLKGGEVQ